MPEGRKRLERALQSTLDGKADKPQLFKGLLGAYVDGVKTIKVAGRPDFVWVRLRGATGDVIQSFNDVVGEHFDLPVLVFRDPNNKVIWRIQGRDIGQYSDWGAASYLPPHGRSHTFVGGKDTGSDVVFIAKRQYMELLPRPNATGSVTLYIEPGYYYWGGYYHYWPGSGTADLLTYRPTGANLQNFVTVYLDGDTFNPNYLKGNEFSVQYPPDDPTSFIAVPGSDEGIPIAAVRLTTGTIGIGWHDIYDLRLPPSQLPGTGSLLSVFDESSYQGKVSGLNFVGEGVEVSVSGAYAHIFITGTGGFAGFETGTATYMLVGQPEPLTTITGAYWRTPGGMAYATGSLNAFIDGLSQLKGVAFQEQYPASGTYNYLFTPTTGSQHELKYGVPVDLTIALGPQGPAGPSGSAGAAGAAGPSGSAGVDGPAGPPGTFGVFVTEEGVPIGTGTIFDFVGEGVEASISGTVVRIFITGTPTDVFPPVTGTFVLWGNPALLGSVDSVIFQGDPVYTAITGSFGYVSFSGSVGPQGPEGATGSVGPQGSPGAEGATGSQGIQGIEGATGSVGPQGIEGATGSQGVQGIQGPTGSQGIQGIEGATGSQGIQGIQGPTGSQGIQGIEGATGSQGVQGIEGATGSIGPQGIEGATGSQGVQGIQGVEGATGSTGPQGIQGVEGATGSQGTQGSPGTGTFGVTVLDDGIILGTGVYLDFSGDGVVATISGSMVDISISGNPLPPSTGTIVIYDDQTILGSVEKVVIEGDPAYASITGVFGYISFSGSVGPQGPEGATGSIGPQGAEGATGSQGSQGIQGATGSQGPQGAEGATGSQGIQGIEGATGSQGIQGVQGPTGSQGIQGIEGATGSQGIQGIQGIEGATGSQGPQGIEGATGSQGIQGIEGATGSQGIQGVQGPTGSQGIQGIEGATGSQGPQGIEGATGSQGTPGISGGQLGIMVWDEGVPLQTGTTFNFVGGGVVATISGTVAEITIEGGQVAGSGSTYVRAGNPIALDTQTGGYWRINDPQYATGTLSVAINGVWQQPTIDYQEQWPASGTFEVLIGLETGSILSSIWGVPASGGGGGSLPSYQTYWEPDAPPVTGSVYDDEFDDANPTGTLWTIFDPGGTMSYGMTPEGFLKMTHGSLDGVAGFLQPLPDGGTGTYTAYARFSHIGYHSGDSKAGILLAEDGIASPGSSALRLYVIGEGGYGSVYQVERWLDYNSASGNDYNESQAHAADWTWLRVRRDSAGNMYMDVSQDGYYWQQVTSNGEDFTAKEIGIFTKPSVTDQAVYFHWFRFLEGQDERIQMPAGRLIRRYFDE